MTARMPRPTRLRRTSPSTRTTSAPRPSPRPAHPRSATSRALSVTPGQSPWSATRTGPKRRRLPAGPAGADRVESRVRRPVSETGRTGWRGSSHWASAAASASFPASEAPQDPGRPGRAAGPAYAVPAGVADLGPPPNSTPEADPWSLTDVLPDQVAHREAQAPLRGRGQGAGPGRRPGPAHGPLAGRSPDEPQPEGGAQRGTRRRGAVRPQPRGPGPTWPRSSVAGSPHHSGIGEPKRMRLPSGSTCEPSRSL